MRIALVGNQNSGKTSLFNVLTGMNQKVGNWPGVTLEKKVGIIKGTKHELIDLPGIYSLYPYTIEEKVSRNFLLNENPDLIINIIDATSLERGLYLTTQMMELDTRIIVVLNMADRLKKKGLSIDTNILEDKLGLDVCMISALKGEGIDVLVKLINCGRRKYRKVKVFSRNIEEAIYNVALKNKNRCNKRFYAIEMLEDDYDKSCYEINILRREYKLDPYEIFINSRYNFIENVCKSAVTRKRIKFNLNHCLDKIFLNKFLGIPIFATVMCFVYFLTISVVGNYFMDFSAACLEEIQNYLKIILFDLGASSWSISLVCDGILTGVGSVLSFLPQLCMLFFCIAIMESTGYMSRVSFLLDKLFRKVGLSGKAIIPFIVGSGCSVPGIMSSRILENEYDRKIVSILTPFIPCSAKLPIIALFCAYFFKETYFLAVISFYLLSILVIVAMALIIKKFCGKHDVSSFVSELPEYRMPNFKYVLRDVYGKCSEFIKKAGSLIFIASVSVWFFLSFSLDFEYGVPIEDSFLAFIGKKLSWFFYPVIGRNSWELTVSAIQGLVAKEQVVSSMEIIAGFLNNENIFNSGAFEFLNKASAYAFIAFNLFTAPCFASIASMKKELGSMKLLLATLCLQIFGAWIISIFLFNFLNFLNIN